MFVLVLTDGVKTCACPAVHYMPLCGRVEVGKPENTITIEARDLNVVADSSYRESERMHSRDFKHQEYMENNHMVSVHAYNST